MFFKRIFYFCSFICVLCFCLVAFSCFWCLLVPCILFCAFCACKILSWKKIKSLKLSFGTFWYLVCAFRACKILLWKKKKKVYNCLNNFIYITTYISLIIGKSLTLSWRMSLSYRNQLRSKLIYWFLYDRDLRHERVKPFMHNAEKRSNIL